MFSKKSRKFHDQDIGTKKLQGLKLRDLDQFN